MADAASRGERALEGSSLTVEPFEVGGDAPLYLGGSGIDLQASGFIFREARTAPSSPTCPGWRELDDDVLARFAASDLVLVDGTFWRDDELARLGISARSAREWATCRCRVRAGRSRRWPACSGPRKVLVHINNTNPILLEDSPERAAVVRAGVEVAYDGLEIEL